MSLSQALNQFAQNLGRYRINARTGYSGALGMVMFVVLGCIIGIEWFIQSRSED